MTKARAHIYVTGRVQGVFYRSFVRARARLLNLNGWAKNTMDGCVEIVFEGETEDINTALDECKRGPPHAQVTDFRVTWEKHRGEFAGFDIKQ